MASSTSEWMNVTQAVEQWTEFQESYVKQINNFFSANPVGASASQSWSDWLSSGMLDSIPNYTMLLFTQPEKWGATESSLAALMKATYDRLASSQSGAFDAVVEGTGKALEIAQTSQSSPDMIAKLIDNQLSLMESLKTQQENWFSAFADFQAGLNAWSYKQLSNVSDTPETATPKAAPKTVAKKEEAKPTTTVKPKAEVQAAATAVKSTVTAEVAPVAKKEAQPQAKVSTKPATPAKGKNRATKKAAAKTTAAKTTAAKTTAVKPAAQTKAVVKTEEVKPVEAKAATPSKPAAPAASATPATSVTTAPAASAPQPAAAKADPAPSTNKGTE